MTELMQMPLSYKGKLAQNLFFKPVFKEMLDLSFMTLMLNVVSKQDIAFVDNLQNIVQKQNGCGFTPKGDVSMYNRTIEVSPTKVNLSLCIDAFNNTLEQEKLKKGNQKYNTEGTQAMDILVKLVQDGMFLDYNRIAWFGDKSSTDINLNVADGFWFHIYNLVNANAIPRVNTNSGSPLAPGDALAYVKSVYNNAPLVLKGVAKNLKQIHVSGDVYDAYAEDIQNLGGGDMGMQMLISGVAQQFYQGVLLVPHYEWNQFTIGNGSPETHQILYTAQKNLIFATDLYSDLSALEVFYDRVQEKMIIKANNSIGTNYVHESLMSVGY